MALSWRDGDVTSTISRHNAAGALCYCFPHIVEGLHPHRQGEPNVISSIQSGAAILGFLGILYLYVGWNNMQAGCS